MNNQKFRTSITDWRSLQSSTRCESPRGAIVPRILDPASKASHRFRCRYSEVIGDKLTILFPDFVREKFISKELGATFGGATTTFGNVNESVLCCRVIPCNLASRRNINQCHEILGSELIIPYPCVWATRTIDR